MTHRKRSSLDKLNPMEYSVIFELSLLIVDSFQVTKTRVLVKERLGRGLGGQ